MGTSRSAGQPWRILVHDHKAGVSHHVGSDRAFGGGGKDSEHERHIELSGTVFDELVVGRHAWIHVEQQDRGKWWLNVGGVTVWIEVSRAGHPKSVRVYGPNDYAEPVEGCEYSLTWSADA